jgi:DNA-binding response OmpR family regulator
MKDILSGLRILILEDESLIALDVEQLCREHGATEIILKRDLSGLESDGALDGFDVAIVDLMLSGVSAQPFAERLRRRGRPFLLTTGLADAEVARAFPGIQRIGKPYSGAKLVRAIAAAVGRL